MTTTYNGSTWTRRPTMTTTYNGSTWTTRCRRCGWRVTTAAEEHGKREGRFHAEDHQQEDAELDRMERHDRKVFGRAE